MKTKLKRRNVTIIITHNCNLNCLYCYEKYKSSKTMPIELAKKIIQQEFSYAALNHNYDEIEFDFMGGEPFIEFNMIQEILEWVWAQKWAIPYVFFTTTNGTLLNDRIKQWLWCHRKGFVVGISYDGTSKMHDINRSGSSNNIDLDFFVKTYPEQPVKMTISNISVRNFADGVIFLHSLGCKITANCGFGLTWKQEDKEEYKWQLFKLAEYYLKNPNIEPISMFEPRLHYIVSNQTSKKWCGSGENMITYDVDGETYPCHLFTPLVLGSNRAAKLHEIIDFSNNEINLDSICSSCSLVNICPTCYGFNFRDTGNISHREKDMCDLFKIQIEVYAYYLQESIRQDIKKNIPLTQEKKLEAKALLYLNDNLPKSQVY